MHTTLTTRRLKREVVHITCRLDPEEEEPRALFESIDFDGVRVLEIGATS